MPRLPYWWAYKIYMGRIVRRGPYTTEQEAYQRGMAELGGDFEVVMLHTRDDKRAKGMIADIVLQKTKNLGLALSRQRRQPIAGKGEIR